MLRKALYMMIVAFPYFIDGGYYMDYFKRLKELRLKNGYTQRQIAFILHTRQEQYSKYESGKREIPIHHLITLCCLYRVSADYVLGIEKLINK